MTILYPWLNQAWERFCVNHAPAHALLICGVAGIGKRQFAARAAARFLCAHGTACGVCRDCRLYRAGTHPDVLIVTPEEGKTETTVDAARSVPTFLALTPHLAKNRVAIITHADGLNRSAANALLKTLEEPPADSYLLLVSDTPDKLLPTVRSRCQRLTLIKPDRKTALEFLVDAKQSDPARALDMAHGAPLLALALPVNATTLPDQLLKTLNGLRTRQMDASEAADQWYRHDISLGLSVFIDLLAALISVQVVGKSRPLVDTSIDELQMAIGQLDLQELYDLWDAALESRALCDGPLDRRLMWEDLFLRWQELRVR